MSPDKQKSRRGPWISLGAVLIVVALIVFGMLPRPTQVDVQRVVRGDVQVTVTEDGMTRIIDRFELRAPVSGILQRLDLSAGDPVDAGRVVARIDPLPSDVLDPRSRAEAVARIAATEAHWEESKQRSKGIESRLENSARQEQRLRRLQDQGFESAEAVERATTTLKRDRAEHASALAAVEVARHEMAGARASLGSSITPDRGESAYSGESSAPEGDASDLVAAEPVMVRSPMAGVVLKLHRESEGRVEAGALLATVGDPTRLEVVVDVLSEDAVTLRPDMRVLLRRWGGATPLEARVRTVEPTGFLKVSALGVEEQRVLVVADLISPKKAWQRLGDAYRVEASFVLEDRQDVLLVPNGALFRESGGGWTLFVLREDTAHKVSVSVGVRSGLTAEILLGVSEGDQVLVHPANGIKDGDPVVAR